ncbi:MAG: hypothetical protein D6719_04900 [Candidatus Dadabacteria bacterium]|nr:MAG: hypothetical protein D6719_04900 [Candidatus Dadabacteria bacterium]
MRVISEILLSQVNRQREEIARLGKEISTGLKVSRPGDSKQSGTIAEFRDTLEKIKGFREQISNATSFLNYQESIVNEANQIMIRAKEIATQAANETNDSVVRSQMAQEVFELRDHLVNLANSKYLGRYVYGGANDDEPPYAPNSTPYTNPASGAASVRYTFNEDADPGATVTRSVRVTDSITITVNTPGNQVFDNAIQALERLGRAMAGYETLPASGTPDGTGAAWTFPQDYQTQTKAIQNAIDLIDTAREQDIMPEQVKLAGRMRRLETASSILELSEENTNEILDKMQGTDVFDASSRLSYAQTSLQASLTVLSRGLGNTILEYL